MKTAIEHRYNINDFVQHKRQELSEMRCYEVREILTEISSIATKVSYRYRELYHENSYLEPSHRFVDSRWKIGELVIWSEDELVPAESNIVEKVRYREEMQDPQAYYAKMTEGRKKQTVH